MLLYLPCSSVFGCYIIIGNRTTCLSNLEITGFKNFLGLPKWTRPTAEFGSPQNFSHPIVFKLDSMWSYDIIIFISSGKRVWNQGSHSL